jgi:16S rRNA processing protein RimM
MQSLIKIGKINTSHGLKGEVQISHYLEDASEINTWKAIMIELHKDSFIPFFIEQIKHTSKQECIVKLEEVNNPEEAKDIAGCNVYASPLVQVKALLKSDWDDIIGFDIHDKTEGNLGNISHVSEAAGQQFFHVQNANKEMLIPIQQQWIVDVNPIKKVITVELPNGFIEVFG